MRYLAPFPLLPGSWDDIIARGALKLVDWVHDHLIRPEPALATEPLSADPSDRIGRREEAGHGRATHQEADEQGGRHRP
jgi:hypothetical protein